jgi:hypothetical protein
MTSNTYQYLSDIDLSHIIIYMRSLEGVTETAEFWSPSFQYLDFKTLMTEGTGLGGRDLGLMSTSSKERSSLFSDEEVLALYTYLQSDKFIQDMQ